MSDDGQASPPSGEGYKGVAVGNRTACAIDGQGEAVCWGNTNEHYQNPPQGPFVQISSSLWSTCGLRQDGSIACWGCVGQDEDWAEYCPEGGYCTWAE